MKTYISLCVFLSLSFGTSLQGNCQIGAKAQQQNTIQGVWANNDFGFQMTLVLNQEGSGEFDGDEIRYTTNGDKLNITQSGITNNYTFILQNNALTLSGGDLDKPITFLRQGENPQTSQKDSGPVGENIPKEILGIWSGYNETIEFKADAQCMYRGQPWPYTVANKVITLQTPQGNFMMAYTVAGNQLHLTINGQSFTYTKGENGVTAATRTGSTGGKIDVTLAGKWCYMNVYSSNSGGSSSSECITLKEDGTYEYYSESSRSTNTSGFYGGTASQSGDRGTWWVEGDRIYYNSQTAGQGSYKLEKRNHPKNQRDPMIVLDGKTYVTFYNRPPW